MKTYIKSIEGMQVLEGSEIRVLAGRAAEGSTSARNKMIEHNLKLVVNIAKKFNSSNLCLDDLIQDGNIGLIKAVDKYDPTLGIQFSTYATFWIKQSIINGIEKTSRTVRLPRHKISLLGKINSAEAYLREELNRTPTDFELSDELHIPVDVIRDTIRDSLNTISLQTPIDDEGSTLEDLIHFGGKSPELQVIEKEMGSYVKKYLKDTLRKIDLEIINSAVGIGKTRIKTNVEIAEIVGLSDSRVGQIKRRIYKDIKNNKDLYDIWE